MTTFVTGSVGPFFNGPSIRLMNNTGLIGRNAAHAVSGAVAFAGGFASHIRWSPDRTGQLVRHGCSPDVWLVRESTDENTPIHTVVNGFGEEKQLGEDTFWPWGAWERVAG